MVAQTNQCDRQRLELLLDDQLSEAELESVARHLEACQTCRQYLEQLAGEQRWWNEANEFLRQAANDPAKGEASAHNGRGSSAQLLSTDELGPVEFSLDFLEPSDNPAMIGRLGEYEIVELIGRGGMGMVLKGYQRELNRYVAIKVMAPHYAASGAARKRFAREAQAAAAVVHPHVVAIHSVDAKARLPYLVMPYVKACSLQARIEQLIESRERAKDAIINRRIEELLNPILRWDGESKPSAHSAPGGTASAGASKAETETTFPRGTDGSK